MIKIKKKFFVIHYENKIIKYDTYNHMHRDLSQTHKIIHH
jgi:hypothetical protein